MSNFVAWMPQLESSGYWQSLKATSFQNFKWSGSSLQAEIFMICCKHSISVNCCVQEFGSMESTCGNLNLSAKFIWRSITLTVKLSGICPPFSSEDIFEIQTGVKTLSGLSKHIIGTVWLGTIVLFSFLQIYYYYLAIVLPQVVALLGYNPLMHFVLIWLLHHFNLVSVSPRIVIVFWRNILLTSIFSFSVVLRNKRAKSRIVKIATNTTFAPFPVPKTGTNISPVIGTRAPYAPL